MANVLFYFLSLTFSFLFAGLSRLLSIPCFSLVSLRLALSSQVEFEFIQVQQRMEDLKVGQ